MKLLLFGILLLPLFCYCQFFSSDASPGYKQSGIFDTVKAVILIDNKKTRSIERIEGYAVREWKKWYGGVDPYIAQGYRPNPNEWSETGIFLNKNKRKISAQIWQYQILKSIYQPNLDSIERLKKLKTKLQDTILYNNDTIKIVTYFKNGVIFATDSNIIGSSLLFKPEYNTGLITEWGYKSYVGQSDTAQLILYVDKKPWWKQKVKLKKIKGYRVNMYGNGGIDSFRTKFYDLNWKEINSNQICTFDFNNWKGKKL